MTTCEFVAYLQARGYGMNLVCGGFTSNGDNTPQINSSYLFQLTDSQGNPLADSGGNVIVITI